MNKKCKDCGRLYDDSYWSDNMMFACPICWYKHNHKFMQEQAAKNKSNKQNKGDKNES